MKFDLSINAEVRINVNNSLKQRVKELLYENREAGFLGGGKSEFFEKLIFITSFPFSIL